MKSFRPTAQRAALALRVSKGKWWLRRIALPNFLEKNLDVFFPIIRRYVGGLLGGIFSGFAPHKRFVDVENSSHAPWAALALKGK